MRKAGLWLLVAALVIGFGPVGLALLAGGVANAAGCILHEGSANPCVVAGLDIGGALYFFGVFGWYSLVTLPLGAVMFLAGTALVVAGFLRRPK